MMTGLERARSLDQWAQALLVLGIFAGGVTGLAIGLASGEPLVAVIAGVIGLLIGWLTSHVGTLILQKNTNALREIDALGRSRR